MVTFEFYLSEQGAVTLSIFNIQGVLIKRLKRTFESGNAQIILNVKGGLFRVREGMYLYKFESKELVKTGKLIIDQ